MRACATAVKDTHRLYSCLNQARGSCEEVHTQWVREKSTVSAHFSCFAEGRFPGSRVTSDAGLILVRELDERLGFSELIEGHLADPRGKNMQLPLVDLLRQSVYSRLAGYEDVNDAERLSQDPTFRLIGSEKIWERGAAALTSRLQSFETELLTQDENLAGLAVINRELIARTEEIDSPQRVVLDMDRTEIPVYGQQEPSAYNGHVESTCYHPLLRFNREDDCLAATLKPGNVQSTDGCCRRSSGSSRWATRWCVGPMPPLQARDRRRAGAVRRSSRRFAYRPMNACSGTSRSC